MKCFYEVYELSKGRDSSGQFDLVINIINLKNYVFSISQNSKFSCLIVWINIYLCKWIAEVETQRRDWLLQERLTELQRLCGVQCRLLTWVKCKRFQWRITKYARCRTATALYHLAQSYISVRAMLDNTQRLSLKEYCYRWLQPGD